MLKNLLYIANCSKQVWMFTFRVPGMQSGYFVKAIPAGQQICLDHLTSDEIALVIAHWEIYGMKSAEEMSRRKGYTGLCYRLEKPVVMDAMLATYEQNDDALTQAADERRVKTATRIATDIATDISNKTGIDKHKLVPQRLEVETVEETDGTPSVSAGVEVLRNPGTDKPRRARMS
jgi:hypothetical protein